MIPARLKCEILYDIVRNSCYNWVPSGSNDSFYRQEQ